MRRPAIRNVNVRRIAGSRLGRLGLVAVPAAVAIVLLGGGVAQGAVPVSFSVSGSQFEISASHLQGTGFSQYAGTTKDTAGHEHDVAIANIGQASISNLCQSVVTNTPAGKVGVMITAGGDGHPATATNLQIGMTDLKGDTSFTNVRIGVDASTVNTAARGAAGDFAQDSDTVSIDNLQQQSWSTTASVFTLTGMHLQLTTGQSCF